MREFKKGDKVKRANGEPFFDWSHTQKISSIDGAKIWLENGTWFFGHNLEHATTPREHAELIHKWADDDSMVIEWFNPNSNRWMVMQNPVFNPGHQYRGVPKSPKKNTGVIAKLEDLENQIADLKRELNNER